MSANDFISRLADLLRTARSPRRCSSLRGGGPGGVRIWASPTRPARAGPQPVVMPRSTPPSTAGTRSPRPWATPGTRWPCSRATANSFFLTDVEKVVEKVLTRNLKAASPARRASCRIKAKGRRASGSGLFALLSSGKKGHGKPWPFDSELLCRDRAAYSAATGSIEGKRRGCRGR
jgi:hypothetical protein